MEQLQLELLSEDPWTRRAAAERIAPHESAAQYALRSVLLCDDDARVRTQAAETLASAPAAADVDGWLGEGLFDPMPSVRDACVRALGRHRATSAVSDCASLATTDAIWWVRRSALLALALIAETGAIPTLRSALGDPFWRVRHAAAQALGVIGDAHPAERERILAQDPACKPVAAAALWFLRARFDPSIDIHKFRGPERSDEPLWNADPAVMTARLRTLAPAAVDPHELVGLLGDPHQPLRVLAAQRLGARPDLAVLRTALRHLEVPGMPHALETTWALLDGLGDPAHVLATELLTDPAAAPAALIWAASWAVRTRCEELYPALAAQAKHPDPRVRRAVAEALAQSMPRNVATLIDLLADGDPAVRSAAALGLCQSDEAAAVHALRDCKVADFSPAVRAALVSQAARRRDVTALEASSRDSHPRPRSLALTELARLGALTEAAAEAGLHDPDPWIRAAVLGAIPAARLAAIAADPDLAVRRRAMQLALAERRELPVNERSRLAHSASLSRDPWIRARSCELFVLAQDSDFQALLDLSRDPELMVRAAAAAMLDTAPDGDQRLHALLGQRGVLSAGQRAAAYARLLRELDASALALLGAGLSESGPDAPESALVREQLLATGLLLAEEQLQLLPEAARRALRDFGTQAAPPAPVRPLPLRAAVDAAPRRPLGRTGLLVSPLGISGAQELTTGALRSARKAGVNLFFWEPGYAQLTRFLRGHADRRELVIVGGTYEGDRFGITRDVKRALHRLRTDYLDVFLLFWTRSPERLSAEALQTLRELKQAGLIRAFGFSTHDRSLASDAIATGDWEVVMTRHSAAHPGAEDRLLPLAVERGVGVLTFSALAYTRLVRPLPGTPADPSLPTAAECYRYSLSQPGVAACWSAPRDHRQLRENLTILTVPELRLAPEREQVLRAHGRRVRDDNRRFDALVRKGHEGNQEAPAPPQLGELLALLMESTPAPTLDLAESLQPTLERSGAGVPRAERRRSAARARPE